MTDRKVSFSTDSDLAHSLLHFGEQTYPWNPTSLESDFYFNEAASDALFEGWQADEVEAQSQGFFKQVNRLWVQQNLMQQFASTVPQQILQTLIKQAQQVVTSRLNLAEQLVQCVQSVLPEWDIEDLQILARPLAYAMRGTEADPMESLLNAGEIEWTELSGIERARLSLAIAHKALLQYQESPQE